MKNIRNIKFFILGCFIWLVGSHRCKTCNKRMATNYTVFPCKECIEARKILRGKIDKNPSRVLNKIWLNMAELEDIENDEIRNSYAMQGVHYLVSYLTSLSLSGEDQQLTMSVLEKFNEIYNVQGSEDHE